MKIKNLTFVDKHIHKIILGVSLLYLVVVLFFYVLGSPYKVRFGGKNATTITPPEAIEKYRAAGNALKDRISKAESALPSMNIPNYTENFQIRAIRSPVGRTRYEVPLGLPGIDPKLLPPPSIEAQLAEFQVDTPPAPREYVTTTGFGLLVPPPQQELATRMIKLIGDKQPRDFHYVTVGSYFDRATWRNQLLAAPVAKRIPEEWWRNYLILTYVTLERQTRDPKTGLWGAVEVIPPLPGQVDFSTIPEAITPATAAQIVNAVVQNQPGIERPQFLPITGDRPWTAPHGEAILPDKVNARAVALRAEIEVLSARLTALEAAPVTPTPTPPGTTPLPHGMDPSIGGQPPPEGAGLGPAGAGQPPPEGAGFGPAGATPGTPPSAPNAPAQAASSNPEAQRIRTTLDARRAELATLLGGAGIDASDTGSARNRVPIWAHDVTVKVGMTYRYRLRPAVFNPLFQRQQVLPKQRLEQFNKLSWVTVFPEGDDAVWSKPVTIAPDTKYFLVKSNRPLNITAEVFRIFGGTWQSREFTAAPGDVIGAPQVLKVGNDQATVDMGVGAIVVDIQFPTSTVGVAGSAANTTRVLIFDTRTGELTTRVVEQDRTSPELAQLRKN